MVKALYPGTFDPLTNGHLDIVLRASRVFDHLTVAVYDMPPKALLFTTEERMELFQRAVDELSNVEVISYKGLTVEVARSLGVQVLVRGLRAGRDFENEFEMALMNKKLAPSVEAVYLMTSLEWQFLSSTRVKEIVRFGADVTSLVPPHVAVALNSKLTVAAPGAAR